MGLKWRGVVEVNPSFLHCSVDVLFIINKKNVFEKQKILVKMPVYRNEQRPIDRYNKHIMIANKLERIIK